MEGEAYEDSRMATVLLKNERVPCSSEPLDSLWAPNSISSHGPASMLNFEHIRGENNTTDSSFFSQIDTKLENCNEELEGYFQQQPEKKRRLLPDQVQFLEKSFEVENKLEPERKVQLAKELGLQPRQVAIWFQNRRARYKTKVLEKEYDTLKARYDSLKADYDALFKENEKTKIEVKLLTEKLLLREKEKEKPSDPITLDLQAKNGIDSTGTMGLKQEEGASSAKSDIVDSDSPHYTDGNHSSHVSDYEDDSFSRRFMVPPLCLPKLEDEYYDDLQPNSCNLGFPVQDQGTWFWQY